MTVEAVIFDWGGTLTPWHTVDHDALWREVCALHFAEELAERSAAAIRAAEWELWRVAERDHRSATMDHVFERAGLAPTAAFLASYALAALSWNLLEKPFLRLKRFFESRPLRPDVASPPAVVLTQEDVTAA